MRVRAFPDHVARAVVDRHQQGLAAGGQDQAVVVDQRTLAGVPLRHRGTVVAYQVEQPVCAAGFRVPTGHVTLGAKRNDVFSGFTGHCGHRSRHAVVPHCRDRVAVTPNLYAVERKTPHRIGPGLLVVVENVNAPISHRGGGVALAEFHRPKLRGFPAGPWTDQRNAVIANCIEVRPAEPRPLAGQLGRLPLGADRLARHGSCQTLAVDGLGCVVHAGQAILDRLAWHRARPDHQ